MRSLSLIGHLVSYRSKDTCHNEVGLCAQDVLTILATILMYCDTIERVYVIVLSK